jgi:hypothetical protein
MGSAQVTGDIDKVMASTFCWPKRPMESDVSTQRSIHSIDGIKVLVLNHTYEPLHFCNVRRALIMVLQGKAENVEMSGRIIHSPSRALPLPAVIRLLR